MRIRQVPGVELEDLEKILDCLPEPTSVKLYLYGFDTTKADEELAKQLNDYASGFKMHTNEHTVFLKNPTRQNLIQAYKEGYFEEGGKRAHATLAKAYWHIEKDSKDVCINLTRGNLEITYSGKEPKYVKKLREIAEKSIFPLTIKINQ